MRGSHRGVALVMVLSFMILFATMATFFVFTASVFVKNSGWEQVDHQVFWIAEAGLQKAIWNLKTPTPTGRGEEWPALPLTTVTVVEALGIGNYTMVVDRWDYALATTGSTASANGSTGANAPSRAIDNNGATFWESQFNPGVGNNLLVNSNGNVQFITIALPYPITVNKVRFIANTANTRPRDYSWQVSSDNAVYTTVLTVPGNTQVDSNSAAFLQPPIAVGGPVDVFPARSNVRFLRLRTTRSGSGGHVRINTLEINGRRITSTGRITTGGVTITRTVRQTVVTDDQLPQNQVAFYQPDWTEL